MKSNTVKRNIDTSNMSGHAKSKALDYITNLEIIRDKYNPLLLKINQLEADKLEMAQAMVEMYNYCDSEYYSGEDVKRLGLINDKATKYLGERSERD